MFAYLLTVIPMIVAAIAEKHDVRPVKHLVLSLVLQLPLLLFVSIMIVFSIMGWGTIEFYGIILPPELTFMWVLLYPAFSIFMYWLTVGVTKAAEALSGL